MLAGLLRLPCITGWKSCQTYKNSPDTQLQVLKLNVLPSGHSWRWHLHWQVLSFKDVGHEILGHTHRQAAESSIFGLGQLSVHCWLRHWQFVKSSIWLGLQNVIGHTATPSTHLHWLASHTPSVQSWGSQYRDKAVEYLALQTVRSRIKSEYSILFHCKFFFDLSVALCRSTVVL